MNKNIKYFLISFLISLSFFFGLNLFGKNLEDFLFWQEISKNPRVFVAKVNPIESLTNQLLNQSNLEIEGIEELEISAKSAISVLVDSDGKEKIIFEKGIDKILPIASLTKLMTAKVVLEYYPDLSQIVEISKEVVAQEGDSGKLKVGEKLSVENLLYLMLIESSNDAAYALTEEIGQEGFVELMNLEAKYLGMENTYFEDSTGISPRNQSNSKDLIIFTKSLLEEPLIWEILKKPEFDLYSPDGIFHHKLININELLKEWENNLEIIGGKTGYTLAAKGCFLLVLKDSQGNYIINIILGSENRLEEMKNLINSVEYARNSY